MKKKIYLMFAILLLATQHSLAVPAYPKPVVYQLPDGSSIVIKLQGDERLHWAVSLEGYTLLFNKDGYLEYAVHDEFGDLVLSGIRAREIWERTDDEQNLLETLPKALFYSATQVAAMRKLVEIGQDAVLRQITKDSSMQRSSPVTVRIPVILVGFQGKSFTKTKIDFQMLMNQLNYTSTPNGAITGSVHDYFLAASYGQLYFQVDVFGPYTLQNSISHYTLPQHCAGDARRMAREAAIAASANGCNFANYDLNNDGKVDGLHIIFAGHGTEAGASACNSIWSHAWELTGSYALTLNGKQIANYSCSPELRGNSGSNITHIGVIAHELSHVFGLPDLYDTDYAGSGGESVHIGEWCIMASGNWNDNGRTPALPSAWCRVKLGWIPENVLSSLAYVTIPDPAQQGIAYRINTTTNDEYFLLENRQKQGWDAFIPNSGMLIYHVEAEWNNNCINCNPARRGLYIKQAGGGANSDSPNRVNDPYPSGGNTSFTDTSVPNSKSWEGNNTNKPVTDITHLQHIKSIFFKFMESAEENADLQTLTTSEGELIPAFNKHASIYVVNVTNSVSSITISAVPENPASVVTGTGNTPLNVGINHLNVVVTAENGIATKTYTVIVTRLD